MLVIQLHFFINTGVAIWRRGGAATQRSAKPCTPVRLWAAPPITIQLTIFITLRPSFIPDSAKVFLVVKKCTFYIDI